MDNFEQFFQALYKDFNARNIEAVIAHMHENVKWANGMEGGYVHGHAGVREYWTKQFTLISSNVTPIEIAAENGKARIKVHQVVHDVQENLLLDEVVYHVFSLQNGKVSQFDIENDHLIPGSK